MSRTQLLLWLCAATVVLALACSQSEPAELSPTPTQERDPVFTPYRGVLHGFEFGDTELPPVTELVPGCNNRQITNGGPAEAARSELWFEFAYLPPGSRVDYVATSACNDEVFLINTQIVVDGRGFFQVVHRRGRPTFRAHFEAVDIGTAAVRLDSISGRPSVEMNQVIYMRDSSTAWYIVGMGFYGDELRRIAEGIVTP